MEPSCGENKSTTKACNARGMNARTSKFTNECRNELDSTTHQTHEHYILRTLSPQNTLSSEHHTKHKIQHHHRHDGLAARGLKATIASFAGEEREMKRGRCRFVFERGCKPSRSLLVLLEAFEKPAAHSSSPRKKKKMKRARPERHKDTDTTTT